MQVFLSYSPTDRTLARRIRNVLETSGLHVWDAEREIMPGDNWAEIVGQALKTSEAMVVLLTPHSVQSPRIMGDIDYALGNMAYAKRLIPVLAGAPESFPQGKIPWILRRLGMVSLPAPEAGEEELGKIPGLLQQAA
ncbi:MAG: toll/interleukin-1 receptor domain-containing protein [Blastocatellia bacterium]